MLFFVLFFNVTRHIVRLLRLHIQREEGQGSFSLIPPPSIFFFFFFFFFLNRGCSVGASGPGGTILRENCSREPGGAGREPSKT